MVQLDQEHQLSKRTVMGIQTGADYVTRRVTDCSTKGKDTTTTTSMEQRASTRTRSCIIIQQKGEKQKQQQRPQTTQVLYYFRTTTTWVLWSITWSGERLSIFMCPWVSFICFMM